MPSNYQSKRGGAGAGAGAGDGSTPATPSYISEPNSPRGASPVWGSARRYHTRHTGGWDVRRIVQVLVGAVGFIALFHFVQKVFAPGPRRDEVLLVGGGGEVTRNHFVDFEGGLECRLSSTDIYRPPLWNTPHAKKNYPFCKNRANLLPALSGGGRHGFDSTFMPINCHYKWYSPLEICMILDRLDGVVFIGDDMVGQIYAAFNMLLRQDLSLGALAQWKMTRQQREACRCDSQYTRLDCSQFFITSNDEVSQSDAEPTVKTPYACNRIPHFYLRIAGSPAPDEEKQRFQDLLDKDKQSWKPVAIIHHLGLSTGMQWPQATESMDEWLTIADNSGRNSPFLWLGPNAAGALKAPAKIMQEGNNALWHYSLEMGKEAHRRGVESLELYNSTLQANSWDGSSYGMRVNLVHAMMIINWLALLETT